MWRFLGLVLALASLGLGALYFAGAWPFAAMATDVDASASAGSADLQRVTEPLFDRDEAAAAIQRPTPRSILLHDPVVIHDAALTTVQEQEVSSRVDGKIRFIAVSLGQRVVPGQLLVQLDDTLIAIQEENARKRAESETSIESARQLYEAYRNIVEANQRAPGAIAPQRMRIDIARRDQAFFDWQKAKEDRDQAAGEYTRLRYEREMHRVTADIEGIVVAIHRKMGESVRAGETIVKVVNLDRFHVEGKAPVQQAALVERGMRVLLHPENRIGPARVLIGHTRGVTALAITPDGRLLASASEDMRTILWDWVGGSAKTVLQDRVRPYEVYAVAAGPVTTDDATRNRTYRFVTAGGDGRAQLWHVEVSALGRVLSTQAVDFPEEHVGAIRAVAYSPDGRWCATGGEDRKVFVWAVDGGQVRRLYSVRATSLERDTAHRGTVTTLHFSVDGHLISASSDRTLKKWKLGKSRAELVASASGRTGDVTYLGATRDGSRVLFDFGEELRIIDVEHESLLGTLHTGGQGHFSSFAVLSPSGQLVLTANANGRVQLWTVPPTPEELAFFRRGYAEGFRRNTPFVFGCLASVLIPTGHWAELGWLMTASEQPSQPPETKAEPAPPAFTPAGQAVFPSVPPKPRPYRGLTSIPELWPLGGYEIRNLVTPQATEVLCGAFSPDEAVIFTGSDDGLVRIWPAASWRERREPLEAIITAVGTQIENDTVLVQAELDNPRGGIWRLLPGGRVSVTIYPEAVHRQRRNR